MFLAVDVGNTHTTLGLFDAEGGLVHGWRMESDANDTSDVLHARIFVYFKKDGLDLASVEDAAVASVVPAITRAWTRCLEVLLGKEPLLIAAGEDCGIAVNMPNPRAVGAERIATATNIDVVDAAGAYRGGAIGPGLILSANALFARAAKLATIPVEAPAHALGDTTETAMQSGLVIGAAAQAEGLVARMKAELGIGGAKVVGTGGLARTVSAATDLFDAIDPDLTLRGIRDIWLRKNAR